jgi:AcrR family transcriptional regulator
MKKPARRVRRSPEEARRLILETAQALIARTGPEGLRLQDIAAQAGISHPLILHHFKSRAGLLRALTREAAAEFKDRLVAAMAQPQSSTEELIDRVFGAFAGGLAQRLAWLAMMDPEGEAAEPATVQREIADTLHRRRVAADCCRGRNQAVVVRRQAVEPFPHPGQEIHMNVDPGDAHFEIVVQDGLAFCRDHLAHFKLPRPPWTAAATTGAKPPIANPICVPIAMHDAAHGC